MGLLDLLKDDETRAEVIAILAAFQAANQTAQQTGQNVNQSISDLLQNMASTTGSSQVASGIEQGVSDISGDENIEADLINAGRITGANVKRTYDEYQDISLGNTRTLNNVALQAIQNAVETANLVGKNAVANNHAMTQQTIDHRDTSYDRIVNVDEQGYQAKAILDNQTFRDGIKALVVEAIGDVVKGNKAE